MPSEPRKNGFSLPPNPLQLLSWFLYLLLVTTFYALFFLYLGTGGRIASGIVYGICAITTAYFGLAATYIDPADPMIYLEDIEPANDEEAAKMLYCHRCEHHVNLHSKHCRVCSKCVDVFDHHCAWLNTCIGKENYPYFICLLISAFCLVVTQLVVGIYVFVAYLKDSDYMDSRTREFYPHLSGLALFVLVTVFSVIALGVLAVVVELLIFHFILMRRDLTTYDYVLTRQHNTLKKQANVSNSSVVLPPAPAVDGNACYYYMDSYKKRHHLEKILCFTCDPRHPTEPLTVPELTGAEPPGSIDNISISQTNFPSVASTNAYTGQPDTDSSPSLYPPTTPSSVFTRTTNESSLPYRNNQFPGHGPVFGGDYTAGFIPDYSTSNTSYLNSDSEQPLSVIPSSRAGGASLIASHMREPGSAASELTTSPGPTPPPALHGVEGMSANKKDLGESLDGRGISTASPKPVDVASESLDFGFYVARSARVQSLGSTGPTNASNSLNSPSIHIVATANIAGINVDDSLNPVASSSKVAESKESDSKSVD